MADGGDAGAAASGGDGAAGGNGDNPKKEPKGFALAVDNKCLLAPNGKTRN